MDKHLISLKQPYEVAWVIKKMAKEHIIVTKSDVSQAVKTLKSHSRRKVYKYFRLQKYAKK